MGEGLTDKQRKSIEAMARAIVNKLLHEPTARSCAPWAPSTRSNRLAGAAAELFGLGGGAAGHESPRRAPVVATRRQAMKAVRIATRQSPLALWQARHVARAARRSATRASRSPSWS